jgi:flagella basal body P-ring formation protein FlgA
LFKLNALTITMNAPVQVPAGEITLVPVMGVASGQPSGTMAIDLYAEKQRLRRFQVQVDWEWEARVPAAARDLPSGKILSESDCRWSQQKRKDIPAGLVLKANELLGMRLLRSLSEGELITQGVLAAPRLVEKGDIVQLALRGKGFNILTTAAAQQAGVAGESIKLMHPDSKKVFIGRVVGKNRVEIPF